MACVKMHSFVAITVVLLSFACTVHSKPRYDDFTDQQLNSLALMKFSALPKGLQIDYNRKMTLKTGVSGFCCKTDLSMPISTKTLTRAEVFYALTTIKIQHGSHGCGFLYTSKCHDGEEIRYGSVAKYKMVYEHIPNYAQCGDSNVACCENHINITGNCMEASLVHEYKQDILDLFQAGILG